MCMYFEYNKYYDGCLVAPIIGVAVILFFDVLACYAFIVNLGTVRLSFNDVFLYLLVILFMLYGLIMELKKIYKGGICLLHEKEVDAVRMHGYISEIKTLIETEGYWLPNMVGMRSQGYRFIIDGVKCIAFTKGTLKAGDYVSVKYLPESRYILHISKIQAESTDTK